MCFAHAKNKVVLEKQYRALLENKSKINSWWGTNQPICGQHFQQNDGAFLETTPPAVIPETIFKTERVNLKGGVVKNRDFSVVYESKNVSRLA